MLPDTPNRFDIIYLDMDPQSGTEISKRRPCLVLSTKEFNVQSAKAFICPITSTPPKSIAHIPFECKNISGTILVDQLRSLDWNSRNAQKVDKLTDYEMFNRIAEIVNVIISG